MLPTTLIQANGNIVIPPQVMKTDSTQEKNYLLNLFLDAFVPNTSIQAVYMAFL